MSGHRVEVDVAALPPGGAYPWLTATVVPRPIAWVCTRSKAGVDNLAPHSFFTVASVEPPVVAFTSVGVKDTLRNVRATGELVICLASADLLEAVNLTGAPFAAHRSEIDAAGLEREPSVRVAPPRLAASPVALECVAAGEHTFGGSTVVFARVVHLAVARDVLAGDGLPDPGALAALARLGRDQWSHLEEVFSLARPDVPLPDDGEPAGRDA